MSHKMRWTFAISSAAVFMVTLDNLVVTTALPVIRRDLHAGLGSLEWTVNAYTLSFAVLLLTGAALGDRFGRRRVFSFGLGVFTLASAAAALAPSIGALDAARAVQGLGGAIVLPLTLTILSSAVPADKRGLALGAWGGISGLAVAFGPLVGGAVVSGMSFGMFGSVFLLAQFFQTVQHYTPLGSGLRILPGGRPGLDRRAADADGRVCGPDRAVHALRHRHGPLLRPGRERRPLRRAAGGGGPGLRRQQRRA